MLDRERLLELCQCPACGAPLRELESCGSCGERFEDDTGTPRLISTRSRRVVSYEFASHDSVPDPRWLRDRLAEPPARSRRRDEDLPHHLDPSHAEVIRSLPRGSTVLDLGCGGGQMRTWVQSCGHVYVGTDLSKTRVREWLQQHGGPDLLADAHFLPIRDQTVDAVYSAAVLEHLSCPPLFAQHAFRVLRPGGRFMGSVSFMEPWHDASYYHHSPFGLMETLRIGGFRDFTVMPGWSGYRAILAMGNAFTRRIIPLGRCVDALYLATDRLRNSLAAHRGGRSSPMAEVRSRIAGAFLWTAAR